MTDVFDDLADPQINENRYVRGEIFSEAITLLVPAIAAAKGAKVLAVLREVEGSINALRLKLGQLVGRASLIEILKPFLRNPAANAAALENDILAASDLLSHLRNKPAQAAEWELLYEAGRTGGNNPAIGLTRNPLAIDALANLRQNQKIIDKGISDAILTKMEGFGNIPPRDYKFHEICSKVKILIDDLPMNVVDKPGLERFLGTSGLGNSSQYTRRQATFGMDVISGNKAFLADATTVNLEHKFTGLPYNAEPDLFFIKNGKVYIGEFKAGETFFTGNFVDQSKAFFSQVSDLEGLRIFSRPEVAVSKAQIITKWKDGGVLSNPDALRHFNAYKANVLKQPGVITQLNFENFLNGNSDWFNMIFNSNFN